MADGSLHHFKANVARQKARKAKNEGKFDKTEFLDYRSKGSPEYTFPKLNESELQELKIRIRTQIQYDNRKEASKLLIIGILILLLGWLILS